MNYASLISEQALDFEIFSPDSVTLSDDQFEQAVQLSQAVYDEPKQWQTYLNALGLFGFENWLNERDSDLTLDKNRCSLYQAELAQGIEAVCHLQVNQFKVCLIVTGSLFDTTVTVPRAVVDLPEYTAHFYVLLEVQEELETVAISGFFSYQDWLNQTAKFSLQADEDWTYQVPLQWFNPEPDYLLLNLRCLEPTAISLPLVTSGDTTLSTTLETELKTALPQLKSQDSQQNPKLWEVLNWEAGRSIFRSRELLRWVYDLQNPVTTSSAEISSDSSLNSAVYLSDLLKLLTQPAMNVGRWLSDELDHLAQELSWVLVPQLSAASALRSPSEEFEAIVHELQDSGVEIPAHTGGAYQDLLLGEINLRLYALTWSLVSGTAPEWTLLLILGTPSGTSLPEQIKLRVSDATGILVEQGLNSDDDYPYLFTSVVGGWEEKFLATVSLTPEIEETLPPFGFNPEL